MNKIYRNTIIISSAWVLTLILGLFYIYGYQKKIKTRLEEEEKVFYKARVKEEKYPA